MHRRAHRREGALHTTTVEDTALSKPSPAEASLAWEPLSRLPVAGTHAAKGTLLLAGQLQIRRDRLPVVQVEQHCRAVGRGAQQVFKPPQGMGADGIAFVFAEEDAHKVLAGKNVEVIEPEIRHDLLQLPFAIDSTQQFGLLEVADHPARVAFFVPEDFAVAFHHLATFLRRQLGEGFSGVFREVAALTAENLLSHLTRLGFQPDQLGRRCFQHRQALQPGFHGAVVNRFGMKLLGNVLPQPQTADALNIAGPWAVAQTVENVEHPLVFGQRRVSGFGQAGRGRQGHQRRQEQQTGQRQTQSTGEAGHDRHPSLPGKFVWKILEASGVHHGQPRCAMSPVCREKFGKQALPERVRRVPIVHAYPVCGSYASLRARRRYSFPRGFP